jgi:xanthine dehydrogenase accessory factor
MLSSHLDAPQPAFITDRNEDVLRFAQNSISAGRAVALATLVEVQGGSARALGAQMAITDEGLYCGFVSGGCTEAAVAAEAVAAIQKRMDRFIRLGAGSPFFDIRLPCGGSINIFIHVVDDVRPIETVLSELQNRASASLIYSPGHRSLRASGSAATGWARENFVVSYRPRPKIFIVGRTLEVEATANVAKAAGYEVFDHIRDGNRMPDLPPFDENTAVALLYHDLDHEIPVMRDVLLGSPFYIGALGSTRTHANRIERLSHLGYSPSQLSRIKAPIGLFPKARDAQSLALSIVAEIAYVRQATS